MKGTILPQILTTILGVLFIAGLVFFFTLIANCENAKEMWTYTMIFLCGGFLTTFLLIRPLEITLIYFALFPTLQIFNDLRIPIGDTKMMFSFSGIVLIVVLLFGGPVSIIGIKNERSTPKGLFAIFGIYCLCLLASIIMNQASLDLSTSFKEFGRVLGIVVFFLIGLGYSKGPRDIGRIVVAHGLGILIPAGVGIYQIFSGTKYVDLEHYNRIMGTFGIPNMFGMYLIFPLIVLLVMTLDTKREGSQRVFALMGLCPLLVLLFYTYARASWLAFLVATLFIGAIKYRRLLPIFIVCGILGFGFSSLESLRLGSSGSSGRTELWAVVFPVGFEKPILGHGLVSMGQITTKRLGFPNQGQNEYLLNWIEGGILAVGLFITLTMTLLRRIWKCYQSLKGTTHEDVYLGFFAINLAFLIIALFESNAVFQFWVWFPAGVMLGAWYNKPEEYFLEQKA